MLGNGVTSLFIAAGVGTWVYSKLKHNTNNTKSSLIGAAFTGLAVYIVVFTLLKYMLQW
ncbi:MAG TPA: hypothetical protein VLG47_00940 [Candidatus Saccharimonadales bacterium]|nr:hypothetical protein [Candidatus Saccharimonadales bacterium]